MGLAPVAGFKLGQRQPATGTRVNYFPNLGLLLELLQAHAATLFT